MRIFLSGYKGNPPSSCALRYTGGENSFFPCWLVNENRPIFLSGVFFHQVNQYFHTKSIHQDPKRQGVPLPCLGAFGSSRRGVAFIIWQARQVPRTLSLLPTNEKAPHTPVQGRNARGIHRPPAKMLHWNEEVEWRGEGLRTELPPVALLGRGAAAHGSGEIWASSFYPAPARAGTVFSRQSAPVEIGPVLFGFSDR